MTGIISVTAIRNIHSDTSRDTHHRGFKTHNTNHEQCVRTLQSIQQKSVMQKNRIFALFSGCSQSFQNILHKMPACLSVGNESECCKFSESVLLHLITAHCKPFLLHGMEAVILTPYQHWAELIRIHLLSTALPYVKCSKSVIALLSSTVIHNPTT